MFNTAEFFIGLRYLRAKRQTGFVSFITFISLVGIALGVAALIVILSVMNGFEGELRERLLSMTAHGHVTSEEGSIQDWNGLTSKIIADEHVLAAAPVVEVEGMIRSGSYLNPIFIHGILPSAETAVSGPTINFIEGSLDTLETDSRHILLGRFLAVQLGVRIGDGVVLLVPRATGDIYLQPVLERFVVSGVFDAGVQEHDANLALVHIADAARMLSLGDRATAVRFLTDDVMTAPQTTERLAEKLGNTYRLSDWTLQNESYFRAIRIEKMMMSLLLSLIIGVAAFNIVASLVMVVTDKTTDIAILRTLGMSSTDIVKIFFIQGVVIGWLGVLVGVLIGIVLSINVPTLVPILEQLMGFQIMPADVYYVTVIPSELDKEDVLIIALTALVLTALATLYPASRAARVQPAAALRYE